MLSVDAEKKSAAAEASDNSRLLLYLYLGQLIVPAFLLTDSLISRALGCITFEPHKVHTIVLWVSAIWLAVGLGAPAASHDRNRFLRAMRGPLTAVYVVFVCLFLCELATRVFTPTASPVLALHRPGTRLVQDTDQFHFVGVHGKKSFTLNEVGLRGTSLPNDDGVYKIVTIGGSTTACAALDDREAWPQVLMDDLNAAETKHPVWIGNAGVSAQNTIHHLRLLKTLPLLKKMDLLVFLVGLNDFQATLALGGAPSEARLEGAAEVMPIYKHLALYSLARAAGAAFVMKFHPEASSDEAAIRWQREEAQVVPLPDLRVGLEEYRGRILRLGNECRKLGTRCVFLTQPVIWRADLPADLQKLLWYGYVGSLDHPGGYVGVTDLARGMDAYNRTLLGVCEQNGLECFDLASVVPRDTSAFYDDAHFNEQGARIVAAELARYLLSKPPLNP
jgi:lysophospholipase L1-like esterase